MARFAFLFFFSSFVGLSWSQNACSPYKLEWFADKYSSSKYFIWIDGSAREFSCAPGLIFSRLHHQCVLKDEAEEKNQQIFCPSKTSGTDAFIADTDDCQRYFICQNGIPLPEECAGGLYFDSINKWCTTGDKVKCLKGVKNDPKTRKVNKLGKPDLKGCWGHDHLYDPATHEYLKSTCHIAHSTTAAQSEDSCRSRNMELLKIDSQNILTAVTDAIKYNLGVSYPYGVVHINSYDLTTRSFSNVLPGQCVVMKGTRGTYKPVGTNCNAKYWNTCEYFDDARD